MLKVGDVVKVYQNPISQTDFEGLAKLVKVLIPSKGLVNKECSFWEVQFLNVDDSNYTFQRWVLD